DAPPTFISSGKGGWQDLTLSSNSMFVSEVLQDRGDLVVRSRPEDSREIPLKILPVCGPGASEICRQGPIVIPWVWRASLGRRCRERLRTSHLSTAENNDVCPKLTLTLLRNGTSVKLQ
ncbi:hypothetical protein AVEN_269928-1, partial [Araneus ventricosus]